MTIQSNRRPTALLLAEEVWGTTLHAMRSLAGRGAEVLVASTGSGASTYGSSSLCRAAVDVDASDSHSYCREVVRWALSQVEQPDTEVVVFPLSDRLLDHVNRHRDEFGDRFRLATAEPDVVDALLDKRSSFDTARAAGLMVPPWLPIDETHPDAPTVNGAALGGPGPVAVRPARWSVPGPEYFKLRVVRDQVSMDQLAELAKRRDQPLVAQEYLEVPEDAVEFGILWRSRDRTNTVVCTGRKRRQSHPEGGVMVWGEAVDLPDLREASVAFLDESRFTGLGGIEFIRQGSELWFVEFNPRLEAIHFLATAAGVDTVALAYEDHAGARMTAAESTQHEAGAWLGTAWLQRVLADPSYRLAAITDRVALARQPVRARAIWSWQDPRPGLHVVAGISSKALRSAAGRGRTARGRG